MIIQARTSLPDRVALCQVHIENDRITRVVDDMFKFSKPDTLLGDSLTLCPGFIDPQINGGFGKEFKTDIDSLEVVTKSITAFGVTSIAPTITTMKPGSYESWYEKLRRAHSASSDAARILGLHAEGPVLNPAKRGAHPLEWLQTGHEVDIRQVISSDVRVLTLAPEVEGGWDLAERAVKAGLRVGIGHSLVSYDDVIDRFDSANMHIVHVYNGMSELSSRNPGLVGVALARQDFWASVIADLVHVHPGALLALWKSRNGKNLFAVSDGSAVLGLPVGTHSIGSRRITRLEDRAVLEGTDTLVGSVLTMNVAARNIRAITGCAFWEAVNFVSLSAARYLGLDGTLGSIAPGFLADMCVIDEDFQVHSTIVGGRTVFRRQPGA